MNCPICVTSPLKKVQPKPGLRAAECAGCGGLWIDSNQYLAWRRKQGLLLEERPLDESLLPTWDTDTAKICPGCKHLLVRYRVLPNIKFYLDHCGHCNGVWFDKDEWAVLEAHNYHDKVNLFFTKPWQTRLREAETLRVMDKTYREKLGAQDYEKAKEMRTWLSAHPQRSLILAFLQADDPYKV